VICLSAASAGARADRIDLSLEPAAQTALVNDVVEIDLLVSSDDDQGRLFAALEAILDWDLVYLDLLGVDDSGAGYPFGPANHFMPDPDGINDDLHDGNALFIALAAPGGEATAPPEGMVVTTLRFEALAETSGTVVSFLPEMGAHGVTRVRRLDLSDVTGDITSTATVTIIPEPMSLLLMLGAVAVVGRRR
jgi:hypothetical protein